MNVFNSKIPRRLSTLNYIKFGYNFVRDNAKTKARERLQCTLHILGTERGKHLSNASEKHRGADAPARTCLNPEQQVRATSRGYFYLEFCTPRAVCVHPTNAH